MTNKERDKKRKVGTQRHDEALHSSEAPVQTVDDTKSGAQEHRVMSVQKDIYIFYYFLRDAAFLSFAERTTSYHNNIYKTA